MAASSVVTSAEVKARIFVSYSRKDLAFAQEMVSSLAARGFDAFIDKTDIAPGEPWKQRLAALIAAADTIVFIVSPDSVASSVCAWEIEEGTKLGKRLIPIVARRITDVDAPEALGRLNWIFCTEDDDKEGALAALDGALSTDLAWIREHTRLSDLARRWDEQGRLKSATLRGADLEAAESWLNRRPADARILTDTHHDFIRASRIAAVKRQRYWVVGSIAVALAAVTLAIFAELSRRESQHQRTLAEAAALEAKRERNAAEKATREADAQRKVAIAQRQIAERNFAAAKTTVDGLIYDIAQGLRDVSGMRNETIHAILETVRKTVDGLVARAPNDRGLLHSRFAMLSNFVIVYLAAGDNKDALTAAEASLEIAQKLAMDRSDNAQAQIDLWLSLRQIGDVKLLAGDQAGAFAAQQRALGIAKSLVAKDPGHMKAQLMLAVSLDRIAELKRWAGDESNALSDYQQVFDIAKRLKAHDSGDAKTQDEVLSLFEKIGDAKLRADDSSGALVAYQQGLEIARQGVARDGSSAQAQGSLSISFQRIGDLKYLAGDYSGALTAYDQALVIRKHLGEQDPSNHDTQRYVLMIIAQVGAVKLKLGDRAGALVAFQEGLNIARKLAGRDPNNAYAQYDYARSLAMTASASDKPVPLYRQAVAIVDTLIREGRLPPAHKEALEVLQNLLAKAEAATP